jgi:hypothetical protein
MERMHFEDFMWFAYWLSVIPDVPADTLWHLQSFLMSHGFLRDRTLTVGRSSLAGCTEERWQWLLAMRRGNKQAPLANTASVTGNFMEMPCFLMQAQEDGQIPLDEYIVFHDDISAGEELLSDYEEKYFVEHDKQLRHVCPPDLLPVLLNIVSVLDPRVTEALLAHMRA